MQVEDMLARCRLRTCLRSQMRLPVWEVVVQAVVVVNGDADSCDGDRGVWLKEELPQGDACPSLVLPRAATGCS